MENVVFHFPLSTMPLPTLLVKGNLTPVENVTYVENLDDIKPLQFIVDKFRELSKSNGIASRVVVLKSKTGSGKSTALPPTVFNEFVRGKSAGNVICTQPRVINAVTIPIGIADKGFYGKFTLGDDLGYQTGSVIRRPASKSGHLLYTTLGVLTQQLKTLTDEQMLEKYRFIMLDEVHERTVDLDMTMYLVKEFLERNKADPRLPFVVLMSATIDPFIFSRYYGVPNSNIIQVEGTAYPRPGKFLDEPSPNFAKGAAELALKLHRDNVSDEPSLADIAIIMPGAAAIRKCIQELTRANDSLDDPFLIITLDSVTVSSQNSDYQNMFKPLKETKTFTQKHRRGKVPKRRIIVSTSVLETGVTLETLKYIIDCGWDNSQEYHPPYNTNGLIRKPAARSNIMQRWGRVGRVAPGFFFAMYTEDTFNSLLELQHPEMLKSDISDVLLIITQQKRREAESAKREPAGLTMEDIDLISMPPIDSIQEALKKLYALGFIKPGPDGAVTTSFGAFASTLANRMNVENIKMILSGYVYGCSILDLTTIAAFYNIQRRHYVPADPLHYLEVLYEALPLIFTPHERKLMSKVTRGGGGNFSKSSYRADEKTNAAMLATYRARMLIGDQFIESALIFNVFKKHSVIGDAKKWCEKYDLTYSAFLAAVESRDTYIENLIGVGIDPFYGKPLDSYMMDAVDTDGHATFDNEFMSAVLKYKRCIYEGFKLNLAHFDEKTNQYVAVLKDLPINTFKLFTEAEIDNAKLKAAGIGAECVTIIPKIVLFDRLNLVQNKQTNMWAIDTERLSIVDGFYEIDDGLLR